MKKTVLAALAIALVSTTAFAAPITPTGNFGNFPVASFGGVGIPTDAVMYSTFIGGNGDLITLALTAHARFANMTPGNDGAGTYFVESGGDMTSAPTAGCPIPANCAPWNFGWYVSVLGTGTYQFRLAYDNDPGVTDEASLLTAFSVAGSAGTAQDSWNLGFAFLAPFNPNDVGQRSFLLTASTISARPEELGRVSMNVQAVPEPATLVMFGTGIVGLFIARRRRA